LVAHCHVVARVERRPHGLHTAVCFLNAFASPQQAPPSQSTTSGGGGGAARGQQRSTSGGWESEEQGPTATRRRLQRCTSNGGVDLDRKSFKLRSFFNGRIKIQRLSKAGDVAS